MYSCKQKCQQQILQIQVSSFEAGLFPYQKQDRLNQKVNLSKWNATKLASRLNPKTECRVAEPDCLSVRNELELGMRTD